MSRLKSSFLGKGLALALAGFSAMAMSTTAIAQDACLARCQAEESRCLQDSKGDRAKCDAVATQCFQTCRKPR